jgi:TrmH family RNA methyltransferase
LEYPQSLMKMLPKNKIRLIRSLALKRNRSDEGLFVAEGRKLVMDLTTSQLTLHEVFCTEEVLAGLANVKFDRITVLKKNEIERISALKSTPDVIALFEIPEYDISWEEIRNGLTLALDSVQDPGNLGTIVRLADWFGIKNMICSEDCADLYNPKTIQATMGAIARIKVHYLSVRNFLSEAIKLNIPVYGTFLHGENLYTTNLTSNGIVAMGNEGKGISEEIEILISRKISIPSYPEGTTGSESLNVAVAASIVCAEFRRRVIRK